MKLKLTLELDEEEIKTLRDDWIEMREEFSVSEDEYSFDRYLSDSVWHFVVSASIELGLKPHEGLKTEHLLKLVVSKLGVKTNG